MLDKARELLELAGKASERPWEATESNGDCGKIGKCPKGLIHCDDDCLIKCEDWEIYQGAWLNGPKWVECGDYSFFTDEDAAYIVAACNNAPALAAAYIELYQKLARLERIEAAARKRQQLIDKRRELRGGNPTIHELIPELGPLIEAIHQADIALEQALKGE